MAAPLPLTAYVCAHFSCKTKIHTLGLTADGGGLAVGTSDSVEVFKLRFTFTRTSKPLKLGLGSSKWLNRLSIPFSLRGQRSA